MNLWQNGTQWFLCKVQKLSLFKKITYSYSLLIGIVIIGSSTGLLLGDFYHRKAQSTLLIARTQQDLLVLLEKEVLNIRSHPQQLMLVLGDSIWFDFERSRFNNRLAGSLKTLESLKEFAQQNPRNLADSYQDFTDLLQEYSQSLAAYDQWVKSFWKKVQAGNVSPAQVLQTQQKLLAEMRTDQALSIELQFERLNNRMEALLEAAQEQQTQASVDFGNIETLRLQVIGLGMMGSTILAIGLAWLTSRAITEPIETTTRIAQRVTQESRFDLQAMVHTQDEVGILAHSLNQLITWIGNHTEVLNHKNQELLDALSQVKAMQKQLVVQEKLASLGGLTAGIAHEIRNPLNFINNFSELSEELIQEILEEMGHVSHALDSEFRENIEELLLTLQQNINKICQHGQRAESIVGNMLLHSREGSGQWESININQILEESVNLGYHGMRAKNTSFNVTIEKKYDPTISNIEAVRQDISRVLLNLINNACYAVHQKKQISDAEFIPTITLQTQDQISHIKIIISDNGIGISSDLIEKIFNPFFTTKPPGEGTGLGLSLSYDIIVQRHSGDLQVESEVGAFTKFVITLPKTRLPSQSLHTAHNEDDEDTALAATPIPQQSLSTSDYVL